ncbi:phosphoribosylformylglycinamidine cyclo-ligase [bacterium]|nr:phosphoribosylformylglycinamidine cyclo-ligase [bacterium]
MDYKSAGVDIEAGETAVRKIKESVRSTFNASVLTDIGKFGGFYALNTSEYRQPVLVSSIDGVGTKLKVAFMMKKHDTVGEDLVNHCINDILVGGARPLFFLDYIGTGILDTGDVESLVSGMVRGCRANGCALIGGEMAEMPGFYQAGEYDVAGCIVGIVEKDRVIDGSSIQRGDVLIGLPSTGLHTNGYSLARKVLFEHANYTVDTRVDGMDGTLGEILLSVHRCYFPVVAPVLDRIEMRGMSHITGGGIVGNTKRILPEGLSLSIDWDAWKIPGIFRLIQKAGNVPEEDMRRTFNMGVGYIFIVRAADAPVLQEMLGEQGEAPFRVGEVV